MSNVLYNPPRIRKPERMPSGETLLGATLVNPEKNHREYRGRIECLDGEYTAITEWGRSGKVGSHRKVVYRGESLREARGAVNQKIREKVKSGYTSKEVPTL